MLLTGPADAAEVETARKHVAGCDECRRETAQLAADAEFLRRDGKPEVPSYLGTRIMAEIRQRRAQPGPCFGPDRAVARLTALGLVAAGIWLGVALGRGMTGPQQSLPERMAQLGVDLPNGEDK